MSQGILLALAVAALLYATFAKRLSDSIVTPPMVFLGLGIALAGFSSGGGHGLEETLHLVAEITLVIVLFSDAAMVKFRMLRHDLALPGRMLLIGLPLAIAFGLLVNLLLLPGWPVWELALLAAILAPTDAALGQAVITNPHVPERIRRALTVESGVNDGLALPAVLFFACLAVGGVHDNVQTSWAVFTAKQIGLGALVGAAVGAGGALLMRFATARGLTNETFEGIGVLALAATSYLLAAQVGGNGFLAAFAGGLAFGALLEGRCAFVFEFIETEGQLLVLGTFLLLGMSITPDVMAHMEPIWLVLVLVSLFVSRPLAIWISLAGSPVTRFEKGFLGWFGPRGLATALFALLVLQQFDRLQHGEEILLISFLAVLISAVLHGVTAAPGARMIARRTPNSLSTTQEVPE